MELCPVVHFELPAKDRKRSSQFYSKVFGWKAQQMGAEMGNYIVLQTTETDEKGMIKKPGAINGGIYESTDDELSQHPSVVISVSNLESFMEKVKQEGGKIHGEPQDIPGVGRFVSIVDTEGNRISILQPLKMV